MFCLNPHIKLVTSILCFATLLFTSLCKDKAPAKQYVGTTTKSTYPDLKEIQNSGKMKVLAENSSASYFIYRGKKMGFEYEILKEFAEEIGVELEIKIVHDLDEITTRLNNGEGDLIACNFTITKERNKKINFTKPFLRTSQVLIQRKPADWRKMKKREWKQQVITDPIDLIGKKVDVWENSSYYNRLVNLQDELGDTIYINGVKGDLIPEELIEMVSEGFIDYTVSDENVAIINSRYYDNLDIDLNLSVKQQIAFGVRKDSPLLKARFDLWLDDFMKTSTFSYIKHKYFDISQFTSKTQDEYSSMGGGKISKYDDQIKKVSKEFGWDWRLVSALVYQESKFKTGRTSWAGAYGLMQFMPGTGPSYGVYPDSPPDVQIRGGLKKITKNYGDWEMVSDSVQRIKFTLATYNAGLGHVQDAQALAGKYGKDPNVWDNNVELFITKLSKPKYYQDKLCTNGYLRGTETFNYVREIFIRYTEYKSAFQ